jgi:hypothetical protein
MNKINIILSVVIFVLFVLVIHSYEKQTKEFYQHNNNLFEINMDQITRNGNLIINDNNLKELINSGKANQIKNGTGLLIEMSPDGEALEVINTFRYPLFYTKDTESNSYIADRFSSTFYIFDKNNRLFWLYGDNHHDLNLIQATSDNNYLINTNRDNDSILLLDPSGRQVWTSGDNLRLTRAIEHNNRFYAINFYTNSLIELDKEKNIRQIADSKDRLNSFQRLKKGRFLLTTLEEIIEIDQDSTVIQTITSVPLPEYAKKLNNGNIVAASFQERSIYFLDPDLQLIKKIKNILTKSIEVLPNGNVAISGIVES